MPVIYKSFQSVLANKEGKKLFYPRVVLTGNVEHRAGGQGDCGIVFPLYG